MATFSIISSQNTTSTILLAAGDSVFIGAGVNAANPTNATIAGTGNGLSATVLGSVYGGFFALFLGNSNGTELNQTVYIGSQGSVIGDEIALVLRGTNLTLDNHGAIFGGGTGFNFGSNLAGTSHFTNYGSIGSTGTAMERAGTGAETMEFVNYGSVNGGALSFGQSSALFLAADHITNRGTMTGDVFMGGGNDIYDGRGGSVLGSILGGNDNDIFKPGTSIEVMDGGTGTDTLDFRGSSGFRVALDGSAANTGAAAGDTYTLIEQVFGSFFNDTLIGSTGVDRLAGFLGDDRLLGGDGGDVLGGGRGLDTMTGGGGNDTFVFDYKSDAGDGITDFSNFSGNNDRIRIDASNFGGGLEAGALARSQLRIRADNHAQDSDDRFIFRTTDKTLWFDANGSGAGGLLMVADLQASATFSATDILLI